ncbi:unnamed protein product [Alternaria alternata]
MFTIEVLVFLAIRKRFPDLYSTVLDRLDSTSTTWRGYIAINLLRFERRREHLDRYFFRRYLRSLLLIFAPASLLITPILVPLNYTHGKMAVRGVSGLDALGWSNVGLDQADRYWVHLVLALLFTAHICWVIWSELGFYVAARRQAPSATLRTVLFDSIPDDWMSEKILTSQLQIFPGQITAVSFNRDYSTVSRLAARRERLAAALEAAETANLRKAFRAGIQKQTRRSSTTKTRRSLDCQSWRLLNLLTWLRFEKVDTALLCREELRETGETMDFYRKTRSEFPPLRYAFVTFANPLAAHIACQTVIHTSAGYMTPRTMPLSVDDVVWSNTDITWRDRTLRTVLSNALTLMTAIACVVPVALAGLLSQIIYITQAVSWLSWISELPESFLGLLQGVLPPVLVAVLVRGFVFVVEYLVRKQGICSKSQIDLKIQDYYFCFLFVQVTLVVSLAAGLTAIANEIARGASLAATLAKNLPKASNYFLSYLLLQALSLSAGSLLRTDRLLGKFVLGPMFDKSVTQMVVRRRGPDLQWGTFVPVFTNLSCIGLLYAIISPIILPFQVLTIGLFWVIYSHSRVLLTEHDHGGLFYPKALKHLLASLYLMQVCLAALFFLVRDSQGSARCIGQACVMVLATGLTAVYHRLLCRAFNPLLSFSPTALKDALAQDTPAEDATPSPPFLHEALTSTPVVRIPSDDHGLGSARALQLREELKGVTVSATDAVVTASAIRSSDLGMIPYQNGDVEVRIQHARFLVSASVMSQLSPEFHKLFTTRHGLLRESIELPDEDPVAFHLVCQSAHGSFIPQAHISLETLVNMAEAIRRYKIPATSRVHNTVAFSFIVQTLRPETLSTVKLVTLFRVAKVLGSAKYEQLIRDVFLLHPLQLEALPTEQTAGGRDAECVLLLANLMLRGAACRAEVASTLLSPPGSDETLHLQEKSDVAVWILKDSPSLQEIETRLRSMRSAVDLQREQLLGASGAIKEATADIHRYVRTTMEDTREMEDDGADDVVKLDVCYGLKRLEIQVAEDRQVSENSVDVDDLDLERVSSSSTAFEDIEAYIEPVETMLGDYLDIEDDVSVASAKTV